MDTIDVERKSALEASGRIPTEIRSRETLALLERSEYRVARTSEAKEDIYRLRYRAYLKEGAIEPNAVERVTDRFDDLPNTWIFGIYVDNQLSSSVRISVSTPAHPSIPSAAVFPDVLESSSTSGKVIVDPTRFVADPECARMRELPLVTLRLASAACAHFHADIGLASVRVEHQSFYARIFMHRSLTGPREYPGLIKPICLMAVNYQEMCEEAYRRQPFLRSTAEERSRMFGADLVR